MSKSTSACWLRRSLVAAVFVGAASFPLWGNLSLASSQDGSAKKTTGMENVTEEEMMRMMTEAAEPGEMHKLMADHMAGSWKATAEFEGPGGEMMTSEGQSKAEMVMGGRHLKENFSGNMMGQPFQGMSITSYDNIGKKFQSIWIDEMSSSMMYAEGSCDEAGKVITFTGKGSDPMTGSDDAKFKYTITFESEDKHVMKMWQDMNGEMVEMMTLTYERE